MNTDTPSASDSAPATAAAEYRTRFEQLLPELVNRSGAALEVESLREESCLAPEVEEQQTETRWVGMAGGALPDSVAANTALDDVGGWLDADGWEKQNEVTNPPEEGGDVRTLLYAKGDLGMVATYRENGGPSIELLLTSPCTVQPEDHRMQRSDLDPEYGTSSQYYDDAVAG